MDAFKVKKNSSNKTGFLDFEEKHIGDTVSFIRGNEIGIIVRNYELINYMPGSDDIGLPYTKEDYSNCFVKVRYGFYHRGAFKVMESTIRRRSVDLISCRCLLLEKCEFKK